jgi:hypothetical protein
MEDDVIIEDEGVDQTILNSGQPSAPRFLSSIIFNCKYDLSYDKAI